MKTLFCESYGMPWAPSRSAAKRHQTAQPDAELREAGAPGIRHPPAYPEGARFVSLASFQNVAQHVFSSLLIIYHFPCE